MENILKNSNLKKFREENPKFLKSLIKYQRAELFDYYLYQKIAEEMKDEEIKKIILQLSNEERGHYNVLKQITGTEVNLSFFDKIKLFFYDLLLHIFGVVFVIKLAERNENKAFENYKNLDIDDNLKKVFEKIMKDEEVHEKELLKLINDERVKNLDAIILGVNDALVELTGALVGMAGVINNTLKSGFSGLIVGISAALSMAASSYFSKKAETQDTKKALKAGLYTGFAYLITVLILVFPFFLVDNSYLASAWTVLNAVLVILLYNMYYSVVKDANFKKEFGIMALVIIVVSSISFFLGKIVDHLFF